MEKLFNIICAVLLYGIGYPIAGLAILGMGCIVLAWVCVIVFPLILFFWPFSLLLPLI